MGLFVVGCQPPATDIELVCIVSKLVFDSLLQKHRWDLPNIDQCLVINGRGDLKNNSAKGINSPWNYNTEMTVIATMKREMREKKILLFAYIIIIIAIS